MNLSKEQLRVLLKNFKKIRVLLILFSLFYLISLYLLTHPDTFRKQQEVSEITQVSIVKPEVENGIHLESGLIAKGDYLLVVTHCGGCHAHSLVSQNKNTVQGWEEVITWMQETQGLWELGNDHNKIVKYLGTYYAPENTGRRKNLKIQEWYVLND